MAATMKVVIRNAMFNLPMPEDSKGICERVRPRVPTFSPVSSGIAVDRCMRSAELSALINGSHAPDTWKETCGKQPKCTETLNPKLSLENRVTHRSPAKAPAANSSESPGREKKQKP